jgi:Ca-activated chloride channel homolog
MMGSRRLLVLPAAVLAVFVSLAADAQENRPLFRADVHWVEVYATVFDHKGRHIDGLAREQFEVFEDGAPQPIVAFDASGAGLSCALLLDTTGSMAKTLPAVKNAIVRLIDGTRADDTVAIYTFSGSLDLLQDFTTDKAAAKRAVLRTRAEGRTALFDALAQLAKEISVRPGKKAIVVFTDGDDNASLLNAAAAWKRAKKVGVPVYTVAQGEVLQNRDLLARLREISHETGGMAYAVRQSSDIEEVFQEISADLQHTYMLTYRATPAADDAWRSIRLDVKGLKGFKVRAKEGYTPFPFR